MSEDIVFTCYVTGKTYNKEAWSQYCKNSFGTDEIVAIHNGFKWNHNNVCVNANRTEIWKNKREFIRILTAQGVDNKWYASYEYDMFSSHIGGGGSYPYYKGDSIHETEEDAINSLKSMLAKKFDCLKQKETYTQLTLF